MSLIVKEVITKKDLRDFVSFPYTLYAGSKFWIPPLRFDELHALRSDINPAFDFCEAKYWMVFKGNKIAGRIAGIINKRYNEKWNKKEARIGRIDFIDDKEVSSLLFNTVEKWAIEKGMNSIHGPLGFTDMDGEVMLI